MPDHEVYKITDEQLADWKKSAEPLQAEMGGRREEGRRRSDAIMNELQASLTQYKPASDGDVTRERTAARRRTPPSTDSADAGSRQPHVAGVAGARAAGAPRGAMDRFIDGIELIAAFFVGIVALDIFVSVMLRYFFAVQIPDSYDFGRLLLGILIFWGIAATSIAAPTSRSI